MHWIMSLLIITQLAMAFNGDNLQKDLVDNTVTENTGDQSTEDDEPPQFLINYQAIVPVFQVPVFVPLSFSFKLSLVEELEENQQSDDPVFVSSYFFTLFRQIISPNAP
jgi:hypothetical protein